MRREMSPRYINSLMKEPAGWQSQFKGAEKQIDINGGESGGRGDIGNIANLRLKTG